MPERLPNGSEISAARQSAGAVRVAPMGDQRQIARLSFASTCPKHICFAQLFGRDVLGVAPRLERSRYFIEYDRVLDGGRHSELFRVRHLLHRTA